LLLGESVCYRCGSAALILLQVWLFGGILLRFGCRVLVLVVAVVSGIGTAVLVQGTCVFF